VGFKFQRFTLPLQTHDTSSGTQWLRMCDWTTLRWPGGGSLRRTVCYSTPHGHVSTLLIRVVTVNTNTKSGDTSESGPLFALYSKVVEEDDNKRAKRQQKDSEGIVLFVSPHSYLHTPEHVNLQEYRPVYSLPLSPYCLQSRSKTSGPCQAHRTTPSSLHLDMPSV